MIDTIQLAICQMQAEFNQYNYYPSHIIVTDDDYRSMRLLGIDVEGINGGPKIIPASKLKDN